MFGKVILLQATVQNRAVAFFFLEIPRYIESMSTSNPIGVFDSGLGGLTVLRALKTAFPKESFLYLGDTARLPYGARSHKVLTHYVEQNIRTGPTKVLPTLAHQF